MTTTATGRARVVLIGAGGIGSRHLQALTRLDPAVEVVAVDPSPASLSTARERVEAARAGRARSFRFVASLDEVAGDVDVAVVATGAAVRRGVVEQLLQGRQVAHVILEKFLFQRAVDHQDVGELFETTGTKAWVNTPRRSWDGYRALSVRVGSGPVRLRVDAPTSARIATTAIHFADLLAFFSGEALTEVVGVDVREADSRHAGTKELIGTVRARTARGAVLEYEAERAESAPLLVHLTWPTGRALVCEADQRVWSSTEESGWSWGDEDFPVPLQSESTHRVVEDLLTTGACRLPGYQESSAVHLAVLAALAPVLTGETGPCVRVPIT